MGKKKNNRKEAPPDPGPLEEYLKVWVGRGGQTEEQSKASWMEAKQRYITGKDKAQFKDEKEALAALARIEVEEAVKAAEIAAKLTPVVKDPKRPAPVEAPITPVIEPPIKETVPLPSFEKWADKQETEASLIELKYVYDRIAAGMLEEHAWESLSEFRSTYENPTEPTTEEAAAIQDLAIVALEENDIPPADRFYDWFLLNCERFYLATKGTFALLAAEEAFEEEQEEKEMAQKETKAPLPTFTPQYNRERVDKDYEFDVVGLKQMGQQAIIEDLQKELEAIKAGQKTTQESIKEATAAAASSGELGTWEDFRNRVLPTVLALGAAGAGAATGNVPLALAGGQQVLSSLTPYGQKSSVDPTMMMMMMMMQMMGQQNTGYSSYGYSGGYKKSNRYKSRKRY